MPKKRFRESIAAAADRHRRKAGLLVPISAKKLATRCDFVQQREKKDLRKLHAVARLRKVRKNSGGFDSLHPLQLTVCDRFLQRATIPFIRKGFRVI
jgi:hypothetical protein